METMEFVNSSNSPAPAATATAVAPPPPPVATGDRLRAIQQMSENAFAKNQLDWISFFREVLGTDGLVRKMYPTAEELTEFEKTEEYAAIQQMCTRLRERSEDNNETEPTRVITVRLPKSLHESLKDEAHFHKTSMNQLCISKLVKLIEKELVPNG